MKWWKKLWSKVLNLFKKKKFDYAKFREDLIIEQMMMTTEERIHRLAQISDFDYWYANVKQFLNIPEDNNPEQ